MSIKPNTLNVMIPYITAAYITTFSIMLVIAITTIKEYLNKKASTKSKPKKRK